MIRRRAGFTLLEIIIALAVLAIIATLAFTAMAGAVATRDLLEAQEALDRQARTALARLRRDLSLAWLTPQTQAVNTFRTVFVGHDDSPDRVWFATLAHQRLHRDSRESDQTEITLWCEPDPQNREAFVLLRREAPRIDERPEEGGAILPMAYGVTTFELRYLDPTTNEWRQDWDTTGTETPNRLPRAVQVVLTLLGPGEDAGERVPYPFVATIPLEFGPLLTQSLFSDGGGK